MGLPRRKPFPSLGGTPPSPLSAVRLAPPRARPSALLSHWGNLGPGLGVGLPSTTLFVSSLVSQIGPGESGRVWGLKTSLKTSSWFPQFRGLPLILVTEDWASLSSTHRGAKEGRNQHPRHTEFSPPRPSRLERRPKAQACLDRVRPRGCGGVGLRGGARRCARLAEVGPCCPNCCPAQKS